MMTIRLSEEEKEAQTQELPANIAQEIDGLKAEVKELKQALQSVKKQILPRNPSYKDQDLPLQGG